MPIDTRSAVAEVIQKLSAEPPDDVASEPIDTAIVDGDARSAADSAGSDTAAGGNESALGAADSSTEAQRARDKQGRFAKGEKERKDAAAAKAAKPVADTKEPAAGEAAPAIVTAATPAAPELKPPQDWRAAAREKFATAPREVQEEAIRLYGETRKTLDRAAALEKEIEPWKQITQPFAHVFRGEPPHKVVGSLLNAFATLETGHPQARAQIVANLARNYLGTDENALKLLAAALDGGPQTGSVQAPQAMNPEQIRQLARQEWEAAQNESARTAALKTWEEFSATAEFLNEPGFRQRLALELQMVMQQKDNAQPTKEDLKTAFDAACQSHPAVSKIVNQRKEAAAAKAKASTPGAAAGSGLKNEPAGPTGGVGPAKDTREEVARLMKKARQARV